MNDDLHRLGGGLRRLTHSNKLTQRGRLKSNYNHLEHTPRKREILLFDLKPQQNDSRVFKQIFYIFLV